MGSSLKSVFYVGSFGLSTLTVLWIITAGRSRVLIPINIGLILMYILLVCACIAVVFMGIRELKHKPKMAKLLGFGFLTLLFLVLIGYAIDDAEIFDSYTKYGVSTPFKSKIIGGSLIATWVILIGTVILAVAVSILDFFKRQ